MEQIAASSESPISDFFKAFRKFNPCEKAAGVEGFFFNFNKPFVEGYFGKVKTAPESIFSDYFYASRDINCLKSFAPAESGIVYFGKGIRKRGGFYVRHLIESFRSDIGYPLFYHNVCDGIFK